MIYQYHGNGQSDFVNITCKRPTKIIHVTIGDFKEFPGLGPVSLKAWKLFRPNEKF